jgi:peptide deformylase
MQIVKYPHPALRHPAKPVAAIDNEVRKIIGEMTELMMAHNGLGLAAPQVALPIQLFVMSLMEEDRRGPVRVYINPVISERKGSVEGEEGCLSFPGLYQKVRRAKQIRVQAYDEKGQPIDRQLSDLEARVIQHETDHLHGKLFIDYFGAIAKLSSRGPLAEFERDFRRAQERGAIPADRALLRELRELEERFARPPAAGAVI